MHSEGKGHQQAREVDKQKQWRKNCGKLRDNANNCEINCGPQFPHRDYTQQSFRSSRHPLQSLSVVKRRRQMDLHPRSMPDEPKLGPQPPAPAG